MANYQELLSKAVAALPESNGASRREVYEKARKALVAQLRAINPPLPAREITQHRLELEDCIRQVEHEATEALLGSLKDVDRETSVPLVAEPVEAVKSVPVEDVAFDSKNKSDIVEEDAPETKAADTRSDDETLNAIIARAETEGEEDPSDKEEELSDEEDELRDRLNIDETSVDEKEDEGPGTSESEHFSTIQSDKGVGAAMSRVREVENIASGMSAPADGDDLSSDMAEDVPEKAFEKADTKGVDGHEALAALTKVGTGENDAQSAVDRAIQTLDREARGDSSTDDNIDESDTNPDNEQKLMSDETRFVSEGDDEKSSSGLTIFLVLVILLFGAVGGGGYWAWKEGYVDLQTLFASEQTNVEGQDTSVVSEGGQPTDAGVSVATETGDPDASSGPGNTTTEVENLDPPGSDVALEDTDKIEDRLPGGTQTTTEEINSANANGDEDKVEDRLGADNTSPDATLGQEGDVDPDLAPAGAQSLLLEASADGTSGAVPFSGTVEWSRGVDDLGEPTLIGKANIPARNMNVQVLIRRNADPSLPASHLMEIDFDVTESFAGGAVAGLPGILLKNEELVQGVALVGASARVVGNSFLFALSATEQDVRTNLDLLETRKWMDLALIYASGRRAIITLEKDEPAQALFRDVMGVWSGAPAENSTPAETVSEGVSQAVEAVTQSVTEAAESVTESVTESVAPVVRVVTNGGATPAN